MTAFSHVFTYEALATAFAKVSAARGAETPGTDHITCSQIVKTGVDAFVCNLHGALQCGQYKPVSFRRIGVPKADGGVRHIDVPTVRDRVVGVVLAEVVGDLFKPDLFYSYAFTPGASVHTALSDVLIALDRWEDQPVWALRADVADFFGSIDHDLLFQQLKRIRDRRLRHLVHQFVRVRVHGKGGTIFRLSSGLPQGSPSSPVLANLYLSHLDLKMAEESEVLFVRYADDVLMVGKGGKSRGEEHLAALEEALRALRLELKKEKTGIFGPGDHFDFLGHRIHVPGGGLPAELTVPPHATERLQERVDALVEAVPKSAGTAALIGLLRAHLYAWDSFFHLTTDGELLATSIFDAALATWLLHPTPKPHALEGPI